MLYKLGEVYFRLLGTNGFHVKAENERFTATGLCCRHQNVNTENFTSSFGRQAGTKKCAARLFFLIQPIKSLILGVAVAVVKCQLPNDG